MTQTPAQPRHVSRGDRGMDITIYRRALNAARGELLGGPAWPHLVVAPFVPSYYGDAMVEAVQAFKRRRPWITERGIGPQTYPELADFFDGWSRLVLGRYAKRCPVYPLGGHRDRQAVIGVPYQGTHNHPSPHDPLHNWQSCNAVDVTCPTGTAVYAICDGVIGSRIGSLDSSNPVLLGQRIYVETPTQSWYYAHLSRLSRRAGERVKAGALIGFSGEANGVQHLHLAQHHGDPGVAVGSPTSGYVDHNYPDG